MDFHDLRGPDDLPQYLREFVNIRGVPVPYDFGRAVEMLAALLDNLRDSSLDEDLEEIGPRFTGEQRAFLARISEHANRGAGPVALRLTPSQRERVWERIAWFLADAGPGYDWVREAAAGSYVLPLYFDLGGFLGLRPDGVIVRVPDGGGPVEEVYEERDRNAALCQGTKRHPGLGFLMPERPPGAVDCPHCGGRGKIPFPPPKEHLAEIVICYCGGVGWLAES
jgi:hypothetical protein